MCSFVWRCLKDGGIWEPKLMLFPIVSSFSAKILDNWFSYYNNQSSIYKTEGKLCTHRFCWGTYILNLWNTQSFTGRSLVYLLRAQRNIKTVTAAILQKALGWNATTDTLSSWLEYINKTILLIIYSISWYCFFNRFSPKLRLMRSNLCITVLDFGNKGDDSYYDFRKCYNVSFFQFST